MIFHFTQNAWLNILDYYYLSPWYYSQLMYIVVGDSTNTTKSDIISKVTFNAILALIFDAWHLVGNIILSAICKKLHIILTYRKFDIIELVNTM